VDERKQVCDEETNIPDCATDLPERVRNVINVVNNHLNELVPNAQRSRRKRIKAWLRYVGSDQRNPVRVKNLEKVLAHLNVLQHFLEKDAVKRIKPGTYHNLCSQLTQLEKPEEICFNQAWELADSLEAELLWIGDASYIKGIWQTWPRSRVPDSMLDLILKEFDDQKNDTIENRVRPWLLEDQRDLIQEYRRDRAMITLRRSYLNIMAITLLVLDLAFCGLFIVVCSEFASKCLEICPTSWSVFLLVMTVGAIGSILARATKLSQQPLPTGKGQETPLGIRSLMSTWSVFWAQVMLGATAALIVYLVFSSGLLNFGDLETQTPATLTVLSFIAGYSEPFFLNVVGKISAGVV